MLYSRMCNDSVSLRFCQVIQWPGHLERALRSGDLYVGTYATMSPRCLYGTGFQAMVLSGEMKQAFALVQTYLTNNPRSTSAMRLAGWLAAYTGDWERARILYQTARSNGGGRDVQLLSDLALTQLRTGDASAAQVSAQHAYRLQRSSPVAAQAWGMSLVPTPDSRLLAKALLDKARTMMGDNAALAEARRRLRAPVKG